MSAIDLELYRIPDRLVFPTLAIAVPGVVLISLQKDVPEAIPRALVGSATFFGLLLVFHLISPRGMGFGDVKLGLCSASSPDGSRRRSSSRRPTSR